MTKYTFAHQAKWVEGIAPAADAAGRSSDIINLKNYGKVVIKLHITQGNAATIAITPMQCTDTTGTGAKVLSNPVPIWANQDTSLTDTLVRQADALNFTTSAAVKNKMVLIEIDPATLDVTNGFDCIYFTTGASNAANITQGEFILFDARHQVATPPSAIID